MTPQPVAAKPLLCARYNARVVRVQFIHDELLILRGEPDGEWPRFAAGQYTLLGLSAAEPRVDDIRPTGRLTQPAAHGEAGLIRRAYSISCPMLDAAGRLVTCAALPFLEFYIALVSRPSDDPPMLTPRLFALREGDRLFLGPHPHGRYTLEPVRPHDDVVFLATGTGEAPHNAMIAELLAQGHAGRIICVTCGRHRRDLGYVDTHRELERRYPQYRYVAMTTREPENLDPARGDYVGKRHLQDFVRGRELADLLGGRLDPERTHAYVCGNPAMIGLPQHGPNGEPVFPEPPGVVQALTRLGLRLDEPRQPGTIHVEKYW
jgi:ferredoxin--NADP+ reductase